MAAAKAEDRTRLFCTCFLHSGVQAEIEPLLHINLSCGWEKLLWSRQAITQIGHMPLLLTFSCLSRLHGQFQGQWAEKHAPLMGCTVSHMGMARDVYYFYRKGECLVGKSGLTYHSIPSPFYK